jgi:hypothetical protein
MDQVFYPRTYVLPFDPELNICIALGALLDLSLTILYSLLVVPPT